MTESRRYPGPWLKEKINLKNRTIFLTRNISPLTSTPDSASLAFALGLSRNRDSSKGLLTLQIWDT